MESELESESIIKPVIDVFTAIADFWNEHDLLKVIVILTLVAGIGLWVYIATANVDGTTGWRGECVDCPRGTFSSGTGSTVCTECAPGTYSDEEGASECKKCPGDTFTTRAGATECTDCGDNQVATAEKTGCQPCPPGFFVNIESGECAICEKRTYNDAFDSGECIPCGEGKSTRYDGATTVDMCIDENIIN